MGCCCNRICSVSNCARLLHLSLTLFVFYVLLLAPSSELHQDWKHGNSRFFVILSLLSLSTLCFLVASFMDPGYEPLLNGIPSLYALNNKYIPRDIRAYETSESEETGETESKNELWTCRTCNVTIQLRSKHCKVCQRCVRKFDHHCPWLGNCVGERNHRFFWLFLGLEMVLLVWGILVSWGALLPSVSMLLWLRVNILTISCLIIVFIGSIACSMLFVFHTYLMLTGQTTWEMASRFSISYLKDLDPPINPFDEGLCRNVLYFICIRRTGDWDSVYSRAVMKLKPTV